MNDHKTAGRAPYLFAVYPVIRRAIYEAFDNQSSKITRTQQIILLTMSDMATLSMSELARKIDTSNEQATRAVNQLVGMGYIDRFQNEHNHRIVNIRLTDKAAELLEVINADAVRQLDAVVDDGYSEMESCLKKAAALMVGDQVQ